GQSLHISRSTHDVVPARYIRTAWRSPTMSQSRHSHHHSRSTCSENALRSASLPRLLEGSDRLISTSVESDSSTRIFPPMESFSWSRQSPSQIRLQVCRCLSPLLIRFA